MDALAAALKKPDIDPVRMREMFSLYQETEARLQFHEAMVSMDAALPRITKDGRIEIRGGKTIRFASFENLNRVIKPILREHGFRLAFQPDVHPSGQGLVVHCHLTRGLYRESCMVPVSTAPASPAMNAQQAIGAAISYAKRYGTIALLNLETEAEEDRDTDAMIDGGVVTAEQLEKVQALIVETGTDITRFCKHMKVKKIEELRAADFESAMTALKKKKEQQG
jgi:hypothetical protein